MKSEPQNKKKPWSTPAIKGELNVKETYGGMMGSFADMMGGVMNMMVVGS